MDRCEAGRASVCEVTHGPGSQPTAAVTVGLHTMKLPAGSRLYPCDSLSSLNPSSPSASSDGSMPDLIPDLIPTGNQVPGGNLVPVEDIPLPGEYSAADLSGITITPINETRVIDSAISLLASLIRQEPLADRDILHRVLREGVWRTVVTCQGRRQQHCIAPVSILLL